MRQSAVYRTGACAGLCFLFLFLGTAQAAKSRAAAIPSEKVRAVAHFMTAFSHDLLGQTAQAVREYQSAVGVDSSVYASHFRLGAAFLRLGNIERAVQELSLSVQMAPEESEPHYLLALIYSARKEYDQASREYEILFKQLAGSAVGKPDVHVFLGQLYYSRGETLRALEQFEKAWQLEPENLDLAYALGELYIEAGRRDEALGVFRGCINTDPLHADCLNALGYAQVEAGQQLDEAVSFIEKALSLEPKNAAYMDSLGWAYYKKGDYKEALRHLTAASVIEQDPVILEHLGDVYLKIGQTDMARKAWETSILLEPGQDVLIKKLQELVPARQDSP
jgi:tetratricopeptide (TPR) repeat protein